MAEIKLTEYSHGAGCGCKIAPSILEKILVSNVETSEYPKLIVGYTNKDDAAAFDLGNGTAVLSTTDFFMPIVDDPFTFGKIAATNALSDIYAMGGKPLMAISILGWPINKLDPSVAGLVVDGGRSVCEAAGIPLAGGHSIDSPEPIFGLAVTGIINKEDIKQNDKGETDCALFLTKPLGIGILTTAQKKKVIEEGHIDVAINAMCTLNKVGPTIAQTEGVVCMTDVTGFGLLGHLTEICESSGISAEVFFDQVPVLENTRKYLELECIPGGTRKNFASYGHKIEEMTYEQQMILCDAQTSGGLLVAVKKEQSAAFVKKMKAEGLDLSPIGQTVAKKEKLVKVL